MPFLRRGNFFPSFFNSRIFYRMAKNRSMKFFFPYVTFVLLFPHTLKL